MLLLQLEIPMETVERAAAEARSAGAVVVLDPAPAADIPDQLLALASIVTPNESELARLAGGRALDRPLPDDEIAASAGRLLARGAAGRAREARRRVAHGWCASAGARSWPAFEVEVVDTTAAGDAFNGALAVALAEGRPVDDAVPFACAAGALSVTRPGAQPSMPTRAEVDRLLSKLDIRET